MAGGSYTRKPASQAPLDVPSVVPLRATRQLPSLPTTEMEISETRPVTSYATKVSQALQVTQSTEQIALTSKPTRVIEEFRPVKSRPLRRHHWLKPLVYSMVCVVIFCLILLSSSMFQRPREPQLVTSFGGRAYDVQVGGNLASSWENNQPMQPKVPLQTGPYSVLGKPSISVDLINQVLANYQSPAAGKGQVLYDLGVKYGIDPAFGLAFFLHESTLGTQGEARTTLSLGNLRCIPNANCINTAGDPCQPHQSCYAAFPTWDAGFEAWYKLIRNLYVAQWGLTTVDQIIHTYAPNSDNNNETGYISSLKHYVDTWRAGNIRP